MKNYLCVNFEVLSGKLKDFEDFDTENVGEVIGRYVYSEQGDSLDEIGDRTFLPLNSNIIQYLEKEFIRTFSWSIRRISQKKSC